MAVARIVGLRVWSFSLRRALPDDLAETGGLFLQQLAFRFEFHHHRMALPVSLSLAGERGLRLHQFVEHFLQLLLRDIQLDGGQRVGDGGGVDAAGGADCVICFTSSPGPAPCTSL